MNSKAEVPAPLRDSSEEKAVEYLEEYFGLDDDKSFYTGASFDIIGNRWDDSSTKDLVTSADLVSLATLSVTVSGSAAVQLLSESFQERTSALLEQIPVEATLISGDALALIAEAGPASELWSHMRNVYSFGPTRTSKLLARKRAGLVPIYDSVIARVLGLTSSRGHWDVMRALVTAQGNEVWERAAELHKRAGLDDVVTPLRVIDVVLWMSGTEKK